MGRWAQARRTGGGEHSTIVILDADITGLQEINVQFSAPVTIFQINASDFQTQPSGEIATGLQQFDDTTIIVQFDNDISADTSITYSGTAPGIATPQTIPL